MLAATCCGYTVFNDVNWQSFELVLIDMVMISMWRIVWDLHFILVHRRVFSLTIMILYNYDEDQESSKSNDVIHLDDLSLVSSVLSSNEKRETLDRSSVVDANESSVLLGLQRQTQSSRNPIDA